MGVRGRRAGLGVERVFGGDATGRGQSLLDELGHNFTGGLAVRWAGLAVFTCIFLAGAYAVVARFTRPA